MTPARRLAALAARFERRDAVLFVGVGGLIAASLVALAFLGEPINAGLGSQVLRQSIFVALGGAAYLAMSRLSYRFWWPLAWSTYVLAIILLLGVLFFGVERGGSQRWFLVWELQFQPSEFAKLALILTLARFYTRSKLALTSIWGHLLAGAITLPLVALILRQPDFGSAMLMLGIWQGMALAAGVAWRRLVIPPLITIALSPLIWLALRPYMRERILSFFDPGFDPLGSGYNVLQARIAIGSGGLWGRGFSESSQTVLEFLRVRETDFIFAVIAEQAGLIGATVLLAMFGLVILYCLLASLSAQDSFGGLIATGVMLIFVFQVVINVGMNAGVVPVTGLTLPLVSAGGSSVLALLAGLGLVTSVSHYREPTYIQTRPRPAMGGVVD